MTRYRSLLSVLLVTLVSPAFAAIGPGNGEIGFDFGFTDLDSNASNDAGACGGIRGGYHFTDLFQLEAQVTSTVDVGWDYWTVSEDLVMTTFLVNAVFNFHPRDEIVPYVLAGAGRVTMDLDVFSGPPGVRIDDSAPAYQAAVGARFFFGGRKRAAVRVEASVLAEDTFDESSTHTNFVAGFTWRLGAAP